MVLIFNVLYSFSLYTYNAGKFILTIQDFNIGLIHAKQHVEGFFRVLSTNIINKTRVIHGVSARGINSDAFRSYSK